MASKTILNEELDIATKITNIEERTANIEKDFESIGQAAKDLANAVKCYVDKVETERKEIVKLDRKCKNLIFEKEAHCGLLDSADGLPNWPVTFGFESWDLIDSILECGPNAYDIFNHMKIFFNFLLSKMSGYGANITDVTMLWHLYDKEGVHEMFMKAIKSFGFKETDEDDVRLLLAIVYKQHIDTERACSARNDGEAANLTEDGNTASCLMTPYCDKVTKHASDADLENDFTKLTLDVHVVKVLKSLHLNESLRKVIKRAMAIVVYLLNVGRDDKTLSIIPNKKEEESLEKNEEHAKQQT